MSAPFTNGTYEPLPSDSPERLDAKIALMLYALANGEISISTSSSVVPVADGTYTVGIGGSQNGTITVESGIITTIQEAIA